MSPTALHPTALRIPARPLRAVLGQVPLPGLPATAAAAAAAGYGPPPADRATPIATSGRTEYAVHCPSCARTHRHTSPGPRRAPCGALYTVPAATPEANTAS